MGFYSLVRTNIYLRFKVNYFIFIFILFYFILFYFILFYFILFLLFFCCSFIFFIFYILIIFRYFKKIYPFEFFNKAFLTPNKSPYFTILTNQWNKVVFWVAAEIVRQKEKSERVKYIVFFIDLGNKLHKLNNFHSAFAIMCGLNSPTITRLTKTWKVKIPFLNILF